METLERKTQLARTALDASSEHEKKGETADAISKLEEALATGLNLTNGYSKLLKLKGFRMDNGVYANTLLFENEVLPLLRKLVDAGAYDQALEIEQVVYNEYVKQVENQAHYQYCYERLAPVLEEAGTKLSAMLPPVTFSPTVSPVRIGFFFHNAAMLAHTDLVLNYLEGLRMIDNPPVAPIVYVYGTVNGQRNPEFDRRFMELGVPVYYLSEFVKGPDLPTTRFKVLRLLAQKQEVCAMTWISVPTYLAFASAMKVAPAHIWYSMRFHPNVFAQLQGLIGGGSLFVEEKMLCGQKWRTASVAYRDLHDSSLAEQAQSIRAQYEGKMILGTVGRPEKMAGDEFLWALREILLANPNAIYLWTSYKNTTAFPQLEEAFVRLGIADRCKCVGWVNPKLYAQVFDVYLDSFPSGSGLTGVQAMAAGTPMVTTAHMSMLGDYARPAVRGEQGTPAQQEDIRTIFGAGPDSYLTCADTKEAYVSFAQKLIDDPAFRKGAGLAQQEFVTRFLCDRKALAQRLNKHFIAIVEESST